MRSPRCHCFHYQGHHFTRQQIDCYQNCRLDLSHSIAQAAVRPRGSVFQPLIQGSFFAIADCSSWQKWFPPSWALDLRKSQLRYGLCLLAPRRDEMAALVHHPGSSAGESASLCGLNQTCQGSSRVRHLHVPLYQFSYFDDNSWASRIRVFSYWIKI